MSERTVALKRLMAASLEDGEKPLPICKYDHRFQTGLILSAVEAQHDHHLTS